MATLIAAIAKKFQEMGARIKINETTKVDNPITVGIEKDKKGEYFDVRVKREVELMIQDIQKDDRHLLMAAKYPTFRNGINKIERFLCGHDERNWFCSNISANVVNVTGAKQSLKPREIVDIENNCGIRMKNIHKRHKKLKNGIKIHRQGEFFFVPLMDFHPNRDMIIRNEPMRGGGKHDHTAQYMYRAGGETVWACGSNVISQTDYSRLSAKERSRYIQRIMGASVYVKGKITHVEHATCDLGDVWHKVHLNSEIRTRSNRFLD